MSWFELKIIIKTLLKYFLKVDITHFFRGEFAKFAFI